MTAVVVAVKAEHEDATNFIDIDVSNTAEASLMNKFGISSIPTSVFYDKAGKVVKQYVGAITQEQLAEYLTELEN